MLERLGPLASKALPPLLGFFLPLVGLILTLLALQQGRREDAQRTAVATGLGVAGYLILFLG